MVKAALIINNTILEKPIVPLSFLFVFSPPPLKAVIILACITTARLCSTYACVLNWPFCGPGLLPSNIIDNIFNYM